MLTGNSVRAQAMAMEECVRVEWWSGARKATAMALVFPLPTILSYGLLTGACSVLLVFVMPLNVFTFSYALYYLAFQ